ncbi:MAG: hypothetical protein WD648_03530 [Planctomycetaceae bacterium]
MTENDLAHSTAAGQSSANHTSHTAHGNPVETMPIKELFDRHELAQFDADDVTAGRAIGKMLSLFFLYTVIAMGIVAWWTYSSSVH